MIVKWGQHDHVFPRVAVELVPALSIGGQDLAPVAWWLKSLITVTFCVCVWVGVWVWVYVNNRCDSIMCIDWRGTHLPSVFDLCSLVLVFLSEQWRNPWSSCRVAGVGVECICACINYVMWLLICRCVECPSLSLSSFSSCLLQLNQACTIHTHIKMDQSLVPLGYTL